MNSLTFQKVQEVLAVLEEKNVKKTDLRWCVKLLAEALQQHMFSEHGEISPSD